MFLMQQCPSITDNAIIPPVGTLKNSANKFNETRGIIKKLSDT